MSCKSTAAEHFQHYILEEPMSNNKPTESTDNEPGKIEYAIALLLTGAVTIFALLFVSLPVLIVRNLLLVIASLVGGVISAVYIFPEFRPDTPNGISFFVGFVLTLVVLKYLSKKK
jgi:uncharacterized membrane protein